MADRGPAGALRLDHASIAVPHLGEAVGVFRERLGLEVTVSPEAPEQHGRIHLDRAYLEVSSRPGDPRWALTRFFLGYSDLDALRAHLDDVELGFEHRVYEGVDGRWDDVEVDAGDVPVPILVRRTAPADVARCWPPPLDRPHPCGALLLSAFVVPVAELEAARELYARLLGMEAPPVREGRETSGPQVTFLVGSGAWSRVGSAAGAGRIVLVEAEAWPAVVLGVASLAETRRVVRDALGEAGPDGVAWLEEPAGGGLALGFAEASWPAA